MSKLKVKLDWLLVTVIGAQRNLAFLGFSCFIFRHLETIKSSKIEKNYNVPTLSEYGSSVLIYVNFFSTRRILSAIYKSHFNNLFILALLLLNIITNIICKLGCTHFYSFSLYFLFNFFDFLFFPDDRLLSYLASPLWCIPQIWISQLVEFSFSQSGYYKQWLTIVLYVTTESLMQKS